MTENDRIKESLASAIEHSTPDILEDLMKELDIKDGPGEQLHDAILKDTSIDDAWKPAKARRDPIWRKAVMSCAAVLVIAIAGVSLFQGSKMPFATVSLDVNPGIEISIDGKEHVLDARAVNSEGEDILSDMDLKGSDINVACNAIVGSMLTHGYLTDLSNSILVSVSAKDREAGAVVEKKLSEHLNMYLEDSEIAAAILGQAVKDDAEIRTFADENGISIGKAWLIHSLLDTGSSKMTEADLLTLSTQELILLGQKRNVVSDISYGDAESGKYIGGEKAVALALEAAGADRASVSGLEYEFDCENGILIYEVQFTSDGQEFEYDINAYDGSIVSSETEVIGTNTSSGQYDYDDDNDDDEYDDDDDDEYDDDADDDEDDDDDADDDEEDDDD